MLSAILRGERGLQVRAARIGGFSVQFVYMVCTGKTNPTPVFWRAVAEALAEHWHEHYTQFLNRIFRVPQMDGHLQGANAILTNSDIPSVKLTDKEEQIHGTTVSSRS